MAIYADAAPSLAGSVIMLTTLALLTYGLRVYCRLTRKSWGVEDWIMTGALVGRRTSPGLPGLTLLGSICRAGGRMCRGCFQRHWDPYHSTGRACECQISGRGAKGRSTGSGARSSLTAQFFLIFEVGYCAAIIPIKLSISWMLIRVAEGRKLYLYAQYAVIAIFVVMNIIALIFILINCIPVEYDALSDRRHSILTNPVLPGTRKH